MSLRAYQELLTMGSDQALRLVSEQASGFLAQPDRLLGLVQTTLLSGRRSFAKDLLWRVYFSSQDVSHYAQGAKLLHDMNASKAALRLLELASLRGQNNRNLSELKASILNSIGAGSEAALSYESAMELPGERGSAAYNLSLLRKDFPDQQQLSTLEREFSDAAVSLRSRALSALCIAKYFERIKDFDAAFKWYQSAGQLRRSAVTEQQAGAEAGAAQRMRLAVSENFLKNAGSTKQQPVFIVGLPRSGSTLLESVLLASGKFHTVGEAGILPSVLRDNLGNWIDLAGDYPQGLAKVPAAAWDLMAQDYLLRVDRHLRLAGVVAPANVHRVIDKQLGNYKLAGVIRLMFPAAKIIYSQRNLIDLAWSCYTTALKHAPPFTHDLSDLANMTGEFNALMTHFESLPGLNLLAMQYEHLVQDFEQQSKQLLSYVNEAWSPAVLDFYRTQRQVRTASKLQVRDPVYATSIEKWRPYQKYLGELLHI